MTRVDLATGSCQPLPVRDSHQQIHQSPADTTLNDGLDLVVGAVREVRESPTGVDENLVVQGVDELGQDGQGGSDQVPVRLRSLSSAEVGQRPGGISEHRQLVALAEESQEGRESTLVQTVISVLGRVTGNVTESPYAANSDCMLVTAGQVCSSDL